MMGPQSPEMEMKEFRVQLFEGFGVHLKLKGRSHAPYHSHGRRQ